MFKWEENKVIYLSHETKYTEPTAGWSGPSMGMQSYISSKETLITNPKIVEALYSIKSILEEKVKEDNYEVRSGYFISQPMTIQRNEWVGSHYHVPTTIAGRLDAAQNLMESGILSVEEGREVLNINYAALEQQAHAFNSLYRDAMIYGQGMLQHSPNSASYMTSSGATLSYQDVAAQQQQAQPSESNGLLGAIGSALTGIIRG